MASADNEEVEVVNKLVNELEASPCRLEREPDLDARDASEDDRIRGHGIREDTRDARDARSSTMPCRAAGAALLSFGSLLG